MPSKCGAFQRSAYAWLYFSRGLKRACRKPSTSFLLFGDSSAISIFKGLYGWTPHIQEERRAPRQGRSF